MQSKPNRELVVLALGALGGSTDHVHTEDIALKCHELFPDSFSWTKYPHYPDKDIVRVALTDARKASNGGLVDGRVGRRKNEPDGWILTDAGKVWFEENLAFIEDTAGAVEIKLHRQKTLKQLKRIKDHYLFDRFKDHHESFAPEIGEIAELLRCRVDAKPTIWRDRFEKITRQAKDAHQFDVLRFIETCESAYEDQR